MHSAIDLDNEADFRTIKIDNVVINWNLSAKFKTKGATITE